MAAKPSPTDAFADIYRRTRANIFCFFQEMLRFDGEHNGKLTDQQRELLQCVQDETTIPHDKRLRRIAVKSGKGTGKTAVESGIGLWRCWQEPGTPTLVTAPVMHQITNGWFGDLRRHLQKAHPLLQQIVDITNTKVTLFGMPSWGIFGRSSARPENLQGWHHPRLTVILDEASGIERPLWQVCKDTLTNEDSLLVAAGNPNKRDCAFFNVFHSPVESRLWHRFTWNAELSPLVDRQQILRQATELGTNSDAYRVGVLGEFPLQDPNTVVSGEDLWACVGVPIAEAARMRDGNGPDKVIAIDLARFGADESVIMRRSGMAVVEYQLFQKTEPTTVVEEAFRMQRKAGWGDTQCVYVVDGSGIGQGVLGKIYDGGKQVFPFYNNGTPCSDDYANLITEAYFHLAKLVKQHRISIPNDELLIEQVSGRLYKVSDKGKLQLERKDDYKKRHEGQSPDRADALAMAFYCQTSVDARIA